MWDDITWKSKHEYLTNDKKCENIHTLKHLKTHANIYIYLIHISEVSYGNNFSPVKDTLATTRLKL